MPNAVILVPFNPGFTLRNAVLSRRALTRHLNVRSRKNSRFAGLEVMKGHSLRGAKEPRSQGAKEPRSQGARRWETGSQRLGVELRRRKKSRHHPRLYFSSNTPVLLTPWLLLADASSGPDAIKLRFPLVVAGRQQICGGLTIIAVACKSMLMECPD
jgi:hypothetical protein